MFISDLFENDDMFAGSMRVSQQVQQDRHPLHEYLSFEDFEHLMDEFSDAKQHTYTDTEKEEYLGELASRLSHVNRYVSSMFYDIVENYITYDRNVPAKDEELHDSLNYAFSRTWTETKPHVTVNYLTRAMANACIAAIRAEEDEENLDEEDGMFADRTLVKIGNAIIDAGRDLIEDAPHRWRGDQEMIDFTIQDGEDMVKVGRTFIDQGMEEGIDAMFRLDTAVRDAIWEAANKAGIDLNDHINESDDMFAAPRSVGGKYWHNTPEEFTQLWDALVPGSGAAETLEGELLRAANRLYYQYFNNGFMNNVSGAENFIRNFGPRVQAVTNALNVIHPYTRGNVLELENNKPEEQRVEIALDVIMDYIISQIQEANGNYHPNPGDLFDYSENDDPLPDDDDYGWADADDYEDDEEL